MQQRFSRERVRRGCGVVEHVLGSVDEGGGVVSRRVEASAVAVPEEPGHIPGGLFGGDEPARLAGRLVQSEQANR